MCSPNEGVAAESAGCAPGAATGSTRRGRVPHRQRPGDRRELVGHRPGPRHRWGPHRARRGPVVPGDGASRLSGRCRGGGASVSTADKPLAAPRRHAGAACARSSRWARRWRRPRPTRRPWYPVERHQRHPQGGAPRVLTRWPRAASQVSPPARPACFRRGSGDALSRQQGGRVLLEAHAADDSAYSGTSWRVRRDRAAAHRRPW